MGVKKHLQREEEEGGGGGGGGRGGMCTERNRPLPSQPQPLDGGWGWVVAAGVFLISLVVPMLSPSFGILFSRQLLEWHASSTTVAVIFNAFMVVWRLTGVLLGSLTREFGYRKVALTGTLLTAVSLTLTALSTSPTELFLCFSLGCGLGNGLSCVGYLILAQYFQRRRGLANTWLMAGAGMGHFFSPLLIRFLQNEYGLQGAIIIVGAIILHGFLGATVFHPVEWHRKAVNVGRGDVECHRKEANVGREASSTLLPQFKLSAGNDNGEKTDKLRDGTMKECQHTVSSVSITSNISQVSKKSNKRTCGNLDVSSKGQIPFSCVGSSKKEILYSDTEDKRVENYGVRLWHTLTRITRSAVNDLGMLKRPSCLIIALGSTFIVNSEANFTVMVPFAIQAAGHSLQTAAWCVSVAGICNFFTRLLMSTLSDLPWFNMKACYITAIFTMGISVIVFTFQSSVVWQAGVMGVWGCAMGTFYGLNNLLMTKIVGLDRLTSIYSARNFTVAFGFFTVGPFIGVIRDASGSYAVSMWVLSGLILSSFVLWLFMPTALAYERRQRVIQLEQDGHSYT